MLKNHLAVLIFVLCVGGIGSGQNSPQTAQATAAPCQGRLKSVELAGKYRIRIPDGFTIGGVPKGNAGAPLYFLTATPPDATSIQVAILPYAAEIAPNKDTGKFVAPANGKLTCEIESLPKPFELRAGGGTPALTRYFTLADGRDVYYGCAVFDKAYECSMNSPCPLPIPRKRRYTTEYAFAFFDKETRSIVEFVGSHNGPSKKVTGFRGDGKLLRDTIVPSLTRIE